MNMAIEQQRYQAGVKEHYRNDVQSLRALAIAIVVASHAKITGLQGGFVGVDVFFVLSGYLISRLILTELEETKKFRIGYFYANRLKRLLPALLLMLLSTSGVAYLVASPWHQIRDAVTAQTASLWLSNFYFASRTIDYFSSGLDTYLYLHTWSLAVEEQFYLIWPWLILFLLAAWRWQGNEFKHRRLVIGLSLVFGSSLGLNVYQAQFSPEAGFYLMPGRAWEFTLGAFAYLARQACESGKAAWFDTLRGRSILNSTGIVMILIATTAYSDTLRYPGLWALLPCAGTALILLDAPERHPYSWFSRIWLQQRSILFLGNISYSLYLWHWPILKLGIETFGDNSTIRLGSVCLALFVAALSYKWVENPLHRLLVPQPVKIWLPAIAGMTAGYFCFGIWQTAAADLTQTPEQRRIQSARLDIPDIYFNECDTWFHSSKLSVCTYGKEDAENTVILFGDSVGAQWFSAINREYVEARGWKLDVLTKSSCPVEKVSFFYERIKSTYTVCDEWRERAIEYIQKIRPELVIMGSSKYGFTPEQLSNGIRATLDKISAHSGAIVIIAPTPQLGFNGPACLSNQANRPAWLPTRNPCAGPFDSAGQTKLKADLKTGASQFANARVVDFDDVICPGGICRAMVGESIVFRDGLHLSDRYVRSISPIFAQVINNTGLINDSQAQ